MSSATIVKLHVSVNPHDSYHIHFLFNYARQNHHLKYLELAYFAISMTNKMTISALFAYISLRRRLLQLSDFSNRSLHVLLEITVLRLKLAQFLHDSHAIG